MVLHSSLHRQPLGMWRSWALVYIRLVCFPRIGWYPLASDEEVVHQETIVLNIGWSVAFSSLELRRL